MFAVRPTYDSVLDCINNIALTHYDIIVHPKDFQMLLVDDRLQFTTNNKEIFFTSSALSQLLTKLKIPKAYFQRCPDWLKYTSIQHFNSLHKSYYLFRMREESHVRATLSNRYGVTDDKDLFALIFDQFLDRDDIFIRSFEITDHITRLSIEFQDAKVEHNGTEYIAGLNILNSETGHSSIWIEPVVHIPGCSFPNRRLLMKQGIDCRIVHRGLDQKDRSIQLITRAKEISQIGILQLIESFNENIPVSKAVGFVQNTEVFPNRFAQILEEEWNNQTLLTKADAARRIILLAQELPLFQRIQVEQTAGAFIGLFDNYKGRFSDIIKEINNE